MRGGRAPRDARGRARRPVRRDRDRRARAGDLLGPARTRAAARRRQAWFARGTRRPDPSGRAFLALLACAADGLSARRFAEYLSLGQVPRRDERRAAAGAAAVVPPRSEMLDAGQLSLFELLDAPTPASGESVVGASGCTATEPDAAATCARRASGKR